MHLQRACFLSLSSLTNASVMDSELSFTAIYCDDDLIGTPVDNINLLQEILLNLEINPFITNDGGDGALKSPQTDN